MSQRKPGFISHIPQAIRDGEIVSFAEAGRRLYYVSGRSLAEVEDATKLLGYILNTNLTELVYFENVNSSKARRVLDAIVHDFNESSQFTQRRFNFSDRIIGYSHHFFDQ